MVTTPWVVGHVELPRKKMSPPLSKEVIFAPIKKIATLVLPLAFVDTLSLHVCHRIQKRCAYSNYDAIPISEK